MPTEPEDFGEIADQLEDIMSAIEQLTRKALKLLPRGMIKKRAEAYWHANILACLNDRGCMTTMEDTIEELRNPEDN